MPALPKRLIEVDLPIRRISTHARREKSIRHGHISTLHIWWARRPLAACRAVICAALWPDPADPNCPPAFIKAARTWMQQWTPHVRQALLGIESRDRFKRALKNPKLFADPLELRAALLDFIADFANWDNSTNEHFLATSRALTQAAHEALGGEPGTRPLVVDPFAGGGAIPLEALRVGADAFASDLNPVPVLLNKVVLEYIPKYGQRLADEVRKWGDWIKQEAEKELAEFYPKDSDGATPIAYLWARTIQCEGPGCGAEVPLVRSPWLAKKANRSVALRLVPNPKAKRVDFQIIVKQRGGWVNQDDNKEKVAIPQFEGTVKRGSATCPCCGYTTPVARVREQFKARRGGADDARLMCVVVLPSGANERCFRLPDRHDFDALKQASGALMKLKQKHTGPFTLVPNEPTPLGGGSGAGRAFSQRNYGMTEFGDLFTERQSLTLCILLRLVKRSAAQIQESVAPDFAQAAQTILGIALSRYTDIFNALCRWESSKTQVRNLFNRQAISMMWDFAEANAVADAAGNYSVTLATMVRVLEACSFECHMGHVEQSNATKHPLPDDSAHAFITDPPYYDAVPYADLSKFFAAWLKRAVPGFAPEINEADECIVDEVKGKDAAYFEATMRQAMAEGRRVLSPNGIGIVVFAHKSTAGWEAQLQAMIDAGWIMTGSWPIDTELGNRPRAQDSAALASSVHLVCRPREHQDGAVHTDEVGDWRDVLSELPKRIHDWMPRLAEEGVVGADAIFACLGPALEIFSRYSRVEKASGEVVPLRDYLEHVWAAVAKEALSMVFAGASSEGFEPDARLTAMWLWTLNANAATASGGEPPDEDEEEDDEAESGSKKGKAKGGFGLEYDAARKIAQGLGANLETLPHLVEVKGDTARLLPVSERTRHLFGKEQDNAPAAAKRKKKKNDQTDFFAALTGEAEASAAEVEATWGDKTVSKPGDTTLDRIHQSMILFAANRGEALRRFLVDDAAGRDPRFWRLAQALSALYPAASEEKRWVDGVLARKKGFGL